MIDTQWMQLRVWCDAAHAESLGALLFACGSLGMQELLPPDEEGLLAYFAFPLPEDEREQAEAVVERVAARFVWSVHRDDGWSTRWQEHFKPLTIGARLVICPSWETVEPVAGQRVLRLDPGMAFGTGQHATTRGSLLLMERYLPEGQPVLDVGCGSGILSLGALLCGASLAVGVDIDPEAVDVAKENAAHNQLADRCAFSPTPIDKVEGRYPMVLANIQAHILIPMAPALVQRVEPGGILILSGIIDTRRDAVVATYQSAGCTFLEEIEDGEWFSVAFQRGEAIRGG